MTTMPYSNTGNADYQWCDPATECPYFVASPPETSERDNTRPPEGHNVDTGSGSTNANDHLSSIARPAPASLSTVNHIMFNNSRIAGLPSVSFQPASIKTSNNDVIYALAEASSSAAGKTGWFTIPWFQILQELRNNENLLLSLTRAVRLDSSMRSRMLLCLNTKDEDFRSSTASSVSGALDFSDFSLAPSLNSGTGNTSSDALFPNASGRLTDTIWDSPVLNTISNEAVQDTPLTSSADASPLSSARASFWGFTPDSTRLHATGLPNIYPSMPAAAINTAYTMEATSSSNLGPTAVPMLGKQFAKTLTAGEDTIDRMILQEREYNLDTKEYVWSHLDAMLYEMEDPQAAHVVTEDDSIKMVFPPGTMLLCREKDGTTCSPAYTTSNPHSNEWLKTQVCHHKCAYRSSTASLKRPKTVREHFQKCVWLHEGHPLKVLSSLQLRVLERESQGLLPNRRRARGARPSQRPTAGGLACLQNNPNHTSPSYRPYPMTRTGAVYSGHNGAASRSITPAALIAPAPKHSAADVTVFPSMMQYAQTPAMTLPGQLDTPNFSLSNMPLLGSLNSHSSTYTHTQMSYARHAQGSLSSGEDSPVVSNPSGCDSPINR